MALIPGTLPTNTKYPNDPQSLLDLFASYMTSPEVKKNRPIVTTYVPAGGGAVNFNSSSVNEEMFLNHTTGITGLTVGFPSDGNSVIGQVLRVLPRSQVSATVTLTGANLAWLGVALPSSGVVFAAGTPYAWVKVAASTWFRIQ